MVYPGIGVLCAVGLGRLPLGFCLEIFILGQVRSVFLSWFYLFSELYYSAPSAPNTVLGCNLPKTSSVLSLQMFMFQIKVVFHGENQQHYGESRKSMKSVDIT